MLDAISDTIGQDIADLRSDGIGYCRYAIRCDAFVTKNDMMQ